MSGLRSDWSDGLNLGHVTSMVSQLVKGKTTAKRGALVGWSIANDLRALGFRDAASKVEAGDRKVMLTVDASLPGFWDDGSEPTVCDVVELQDFFRTRKKDQPVRLKEAFRAVFQRDGQAHDAIDDAKMTMELYLTWHSQGRQSVRYETDDVILTITSISANAGLSCGVTHPFESSLRPGQGQLKCLASGTMVKVIEGGSEGLEANGRTLHPGWTAYLRTVGQLYYLFDSEKSALADNDSWNGLLWISKGVGAKLQVACGIFQPVAGGYLPQRSCACGQGEVLREAVGSDGQAWMQVTSSQAKDPFEPVGWITTAFPRVGRLRIVRPFALDLNMHIVEFNQFSGAAVGQLQLLVALKPGLLDDTENITEKETTRDGGLMQSYRLSFRERAARNAYWQSLRGKIKVSRVEQDTGMPTKPWIIYSGASFSLSFHGSTCLAHIWDQPR